MDFSAIWPSLKTATLSIFDNFVEIIPGLAVAILILVIGYIFALLVGNALRLLLVGLRIDKGYRRLKLPAPLVGLKLSSVIGELTKWFIFIVILNTAVDFLKLGVLSELLNDFVLWLPHLIIGIVIVLAAIFFGYYIEDWIIKHWKIKGSKFFAMIVRYLVIFISAVIAIEQIGVNVSFVRQIFLLLIGGVALGIAIAIGLSFGLSNQESAKKMLEKWKKKL